MLDKTMTSSQILEPCHKTKLKLLTIFCKLLPSSVDCPEIPRFKVPSRLIQNVTYQKHFFVESNIFIARFSPKAITASFFFSTSCVRLDVPLPPPERFRRGFVRQTQNIPSLLLCLTILKK